ncbi:MAG: hypothetical protein WD342_01345 [Verrucomicrobiales bacterium]
MNNEKNQIRRPVWIVLAAAVVISIAATVGYEGFTDLQESSQKSSDENHIRVDRDFKTDIAIEPETEKTHKMKRCIEPIRIAWALIWRSTLLTPISVAFLFVVLASWLARFFLPFFILLSAWLQDWLTFGIYGIIWIVSILLWRWNRLRNLFENPPSLL